MSFQISWFQNSKNRIQNRNNPSNVAYNYQQIFIELIFRNLHEIGDILAKIMNIEHTKKCEN